MSTPVGWYPDPQDSTKERRWDGEAWTHDVRTPPPPDLPPPSLPPPDLPPPAPDAQEAASSGRVDGILGRAKQVQAGAERLQAKGDALAQSLHLSSGGTASDSYKVTEEGRNGEIIFGEKGLDRDIKKTLGKNDRQFIPYGSISMVGHDRKRVGRDVVSVHVGTKTYEWKIQSNAEGFVDRLNQLIS